MKTPFLPTSGRDLIIMVGSDARLPGIERAIELYQGPTFETYRANVRPEACPHVLVLTSRTGFEQACGQVFSRHEEPLDAERMAYMMQDVRKYMASVRALRLGAVTNVLLVGGPEHRPLLHAAVHYFKGVGKLQQDVSIVETTGSLDAQCEQLAQYLRTRTPYGEVIAYAENGTPLYDTVGGFTIGQLVAVTFTGGRNPGPHPATIHRLFMTPDGPTADVRFLDEPNPRNAQYWVGLGIMQPAAADSVAAQAQVALVDPTPEHVDGAGLSWEDLERHRAAPSGHRQDLVLMACSGSKRQQAAPAFELYTGVMYSTFRANVRPDARPEVAIVSALHGVIEDDAVIEPYDKRLTRESADHMVENLQGFLRYSKPVGATNVLLAGGKDYRRVMRAALPTLIARGCIAPDATVTETSGGIGYQRQQLRQFLLGQLQG